MQYATGSQQIAQPLLRLILIILLALLGFSTLKAVTVYIAGWILTCALLFYYLNRLFSLKRSLNSARRDIKGILQFSMPAYVSSMLDTLGPNLQTVLLGSMNTITTVGIFAAASQVSMAGSMFNSAIGSASSPIISELHGQNNKGELSYFYQTTTKWMFTVNLPFCLIAILLSKPILMIFGNEFVGGSTALMVLAMANLVVAAVGASDGVLAMTGNTPVKLANSAVQAVSSLTLCFILIPRWGAVGAAIAVLSTAALVNLLRLTEVYFLFRIFPYNKKFIKPALAGLLALVIGWLVHYFFHTDANLILAILNGLVIVVIYAGTILLLGLSQEDKIVVEHLRIQMDRRFSRK